MKLTLTTTLSIASIVAAGAAAYAINVNVLDSPTSANEALTAVVATTTAPVVEAGNTSATGGVAAASEPQKVVATPVTSTTTSYQVGAAGKVVVDTSKGAVSVASIVPSSGWTSEPASSQPDGSIKVHFVSGTSRIEFVIQMVNGAVKTSVVNETQPTPIGAQPALGAGGTQTPVAGIGAKPSIPSSIGGDDDDDDDDDHEERGGDDDHEEDEDDD